MTRACVADWDATGCREELTRTGFGIGREVCLEKVYNEGQAPSLGCGARPRSLGGRGVSKWSREQNEMRYEPVSRQWGEDDRGCVLCAAWPYSARAWHAVRRSPSRVPKIHDHTPTLNQVKFKRRNECVVEHVNVARQREILTVCYLSIRYS